MSVHGPKQIACLNDHHTQSTARALRPADMEFSFKECNDMNPEDPLLRTLAHVSAVVGTANAPAC